MKNVDIIIPVYNAYEYTEECIKSILKNTDLNTNRLLLINDKSPDERVLPMLKKYAENYKDKKIEVLENEENLGFVKTVNKGMKHSNCDVILLNSDTEVTKNWIEKLQKAVYSNDYIATATPFTNNGTICSIPNFGVDNELPENLSLEEYAEVVEKCSKHKYPELTTANGFCMYIKRSVIDEIGYFDDETFGKGYGEENDFCYRALDYGYTHILCDDTFIYHKGTQSFTKENLTQTRAQLVESHMKLLADRYPTYVYRTNMFIQNNPLKEIQENVNMNVKLYGKKKILYLINEWEEDMDTMTGGTSLHLKDIINGIRQNTACFVLSPDKYDFTSYKLYLYVNDYGKEIYRFKTTISSYGLTEYTDNQYKIMLEKIIDDFSIDLVHVHHLLHHTFDIIDVAKQRGLYSIITLHDLYMICPTVNMVYEEKYCERLEEKDCKKCLHNRLGLSENNDILKSRQAVIEKMLNKFDKVIVPSENTKQIYNSVYKDLQIEVIEHGVEFIDVQNAKKENTNKEFNIAFVGAMAPHKGSKILKKLIEENNDSQIKIHLIGKSDDNYLKSNKQNYINHGGYVRGELPKLLVENNIDLVCIFATWPETYSYTLTEVFMAKIPVITYDVGAVADRVKKDDLGWVVEFDLEPKLILKEITKIRDNKEEYNSKIKNFENYKFKNIEEMNKRYIEIYDSVNIDKERLCDIFDLIEYKNQNSYNEFENYRNTYGHLIHRYEMARRSKLWKIAKKIKAKLRR